MTTAAISEIFYLHQPSKLKINNMTRVYKSSCCMDEIHCILERSVQYHHTLTWDDESETHYHYTNFNNICLFNFLQIHVYQLYNRFINLKLHWLKNSKALHGFFLFYYRLCTFASENLEKKIVTKIIYWNKVMQNRQNHFFFKLTLINVMKYTFRLNVIRFYTWNIFFIIAFNSI